MSGSIIGADPDQLENLGAVLGRQRDAVEAIVTAVTLGLSATTWVGPARSAFEDDWQASFQPALRRLVEAFDVVASDCRLRADELRRVMGRR
jgi:lysophospholipase L1-like esterase